MTQLKSIKEIQGYEMSAQDGKIGRCSDFLFDDNSWTVRYIVGDTRKWLPGRKVLISPIAVGTAEESTQSLSIGLTKDQIKDSPPLASDLPVSRQYEIIFNQYHDWGNYWDGPMTWGNHSFPRLLQQTENLHKEVAIVEDENHLRSTDEILSYSIQATDTNIGHVEDFIVDQDTWAIRYLVIDTSNWLPGSRKVIISPDWAESIDWGAGSVKVSVPSKKIEKSPKYDRNTIVDREYETTLYDFYDLPYYW